MRASLFAVICLFSYTILQAKEGSSDLAFKKAVMEVFRAYKESNLESLKGIPRKGKNFWKYTFTYVTPLKIPGEKFNMLYRYPFPTSPLDFVSVIKESDEYDRSFEIVYRDFEKKLWRNFSQKEGWIFSRVPNKESKKLSDLQFHNDKYGAVILDYSRSPNGRRVLFLRFLLFSS